MMSDYAWTVVVPSLNEGRRLKDTVASVLSSAGDAAVEVVVVDDHSDDYSGHDVYLRYQGDDRVQVVSGETRLGVGQARHFGAQAARGRRLFFLDAHSKLPAAWPEELGAAFAKCGDQVVYGTALRPFSDAPEQEGANYATAYGVWFDTPDLNEHYSPHRDFSEHPYTVMGLPGGSMVMDRDFYLELGGFDPGLAAPWGQENMELCVRAWMMGYEVRVIPSVVAETYYKPPTEGNPGVKHENLLYNRLRICLLYFSPERIEKVLEHVRHEEDFSKAMAELFCRRWHTLAPRQIEWQRHPEWLFEKFSLRW